MIELLQEQFLKAQELRDNGKLDEATNQYLLVREEAQRIGNDHLASESLHMIGVAYYQAKDYNKAEDFLQQSKSEFLKQGNDEFVGIALRDLGMNARKNNQPEEAKKYLKESIEALHKAGNKGHEGISRVKLGVLLENISLIDEGIKLLVESKEVFFLSSAYWDKAKILNDKELAKKSLEILNSFASENQFLERRKEIANFLTKTS